MNVKILTAVTATALVLFGSCKKDDDSTKFAQLKVSTLELTLTKEESSKGEFTVTSNRDWKVAKIAAADWLTITPTEGKASKDAQKVEVTVKANSNNEARVAELKVFTKGAFKKVKITQAGVSAPKTFGVENDTQADLAWNATAPTKVVKVTGNVAWTIKEATDGVKVTPESGSGEQNLTITLTENSSTSETKVNTFKVVTADEGVTTKEITVTLTQAQKS